MSTQTYKDEEGTTGGTDDKLLARAKRCFKQACEADAKQCDREDEDLRFQVPEMQWDDAAKKARQGDGKTPPRPMLSISKQDQPIQLVLNQARQAQLGVNIHPVSEDANDDTAEVLQGLYRRIERDSNANQARLWAMDRAVKAGRGWYRVNTKWDEDSDPELFDQEITIERILDQRSVKMDPSAQKADYSDAKWGFVRAWIDLEDFRRDFPGAEYDLSDAGDFADAATSDPDWVRGDGDEKAILVVEYWYKTFEMKEYKRKGGKGRTKASVTVHCAKVTAFEVLEDEEWNGHFIPLIPVIGRELQLFDSERRWVGMVRPTRDAQKFYNYAASTLVERMALEPKVPFIGAEGQFEGHEEEWRQANIRNLPYLEYKLKTFDGQPVGPPTRATIDQSGMSLAMEGLQISNDWMQAGTGAYDPSLGRNNPRDKSGVAIARLQGQFDAGNNNFLASLSDTSLPYEALVILDLIPAIYDRPGRVLQILGEEDEVKPVMLNKPFTMDQNSGRPVPAQPGQQGAKTYDLTKGKYRVAVSIGKSYQTRMQEGQEEIGAILQADPGLMPLIGSIYFRYRDSPGSKEIAEILKEVREKQYPGLGQNKDNAPTPEQMQSQLQGMQQQMQQTQQQLQAAVQQIQTDQAKQQAAMYKAQLDAQTAIHKAEMDNAARIEVARIGAAKEALNQEAAAQEERLATGLQIQHEADQAAQDRAHEVGMTAMDQAHQRQTQEFGAAHDVGMAAGGGQSMTLSREGGQEQGTETAPEGPTEDQGEA